MTASEPAFERRLLGNGLRVVLLKEPRLPLVSVQVSYRAGSANDPPGRTGLAHLFEHMLFQGSAHVAKGEHFRLIQDWGGVANAATSYDHTTYYQTLPSTALDLALWLESDRMGFLAAALSAETLENQRSVVLNERRQRVDNRPYGRSGERFGEILFPAEHPYRTPIIGYEQDIERISVDDCQTFAGSRYTPNNAVLAVGGDIDDSVLAQVDRYFGSLNGAGAADAAPEGNGSTPEVSPPPSTTPAIREQLTERVSLERVLWAVPAPGYGTSEWYVAAMLAVLVGGGRSSRLQRRLVYERNLAQSVSAGLPATILESHLRIGVTARRGVSAAQIEAALGEELCDLAVHPPSADELARARRVVETDFHQSLQSLGSRTGALAAGELFFSDPGRAFREVELYCSPTLDAVRELASGLGTQPSTRLLVEAST